MFVEISHEVLAQLLDGGYTVLKSTSEWGSVSPTYRPAKITDMNEYLMKMQLRGQMDGNEHFLVISEALTIPENQLFGVVWVD